MSIGTGVVMGDRDGSGAGIDSGGDGTGGAASEVSSSVDAWESRVSV